MRKSEVGLEEQRTPVPLAADHRPRALCRLSRYTQPDDGGEARDQDEVGGRRPEAGVASGQDDRPAEAE